MTASTPLSRADLARFTGTEHWHRHGLVPGVLYTDGAKYVADAGGAHWLLDEIALAQKYVAAVKAEDFQIWKLSVTQEQTATLTCEDGNRRVALSRAIAFTDFPAEGVTLYFCNNTILLPGEY